jgi:hypothetical protein
MENTKSPIPLLESVVKDHETYDFPVDSIRAELLQMLLHQEEFDYFFSQCSRKLKMDYPKIFSTIFINTVNLKLGMDDIDVYELSKEDYESVILNLTESLENLQITRVEKNTPDGEMMSEMS